MTGHSASSYTLTSAEEPVVFIIDDDASVRDALGGYLSGQWACGSRCSARRPSFCRVSFLMLPVASSSTSGCPGLSGGWDFQADLLKAGIDISDHLHDGAWRHSHDGQGDESRRCGFR